MLNQYTADVNPQQSDYSISKSETIENNVAPKHDYASETLEFARKSIADLKDGERVSVEFSHGTSTNRMDLHKGVTKVTTTQDTSIIAGSGWRLGILAALIVIPWGFGLKYLTNIGRHTFQSYLGRK